MTTPLSDHPAPVSVDAMSLLSLSNISVAFGGDTILDAITCEANAGERIGLVGRNGTGKTTLLRALAGDETLGGGRRHVARGLRFALVEQVPPLVDGSRTVRQEVLSPLQDVLNLPEALQAAADGIAAGDEDAAETYAALLHRMDSEGAYSVDSRFAEVMSGLGLAEAVWDRPLRELSGGQRARTGLARALMAGPDLLLLDEPTNHVDLYGLRWLESFLARWSGCVIVTSHDRYFLDKVATRIWYLERTHLKAYPGAYSKFERAHAAEIERQQKQYEQQQQLIAKEEIYIAKTRVGSRATEAQSRLKKLARLERIEAPKHQRAVRFEFTATRSAEVAIKTRDLSAGYGGITILRVGDLELSRGERVALVGRNGSGKSTLLRTLAGELSPVTGGLTLGSGVTTAHYWQEAENLNPASSILEELLRPDGTKMQDARDQAGRFLFSGDDVIKRVADLSGGERSRLALAKLVRSGANLLLLDEPTNHLDIPSREALEEALASFEGTMVVASHDRRLIGRLATRLWVIEDGRLQDFNGTLEEYDASIAAPPSQPSARKPVRERPAPAPGRKLEQRRQELEEAIHEKETALNNLGEQINDASASGDMGRLSDLGDRFEALQREVEQLMARWAELE
jgi:ATP-binding cassette, subfamily F, member 3